MRGPALSVAALAALAAASLGAIGCAGPAPARQCADDAPTACVGPAPRFSADAAPLIQAHCARCHIPDGPAAKIPFQTYAQIAPVAGDMKLELETCEMPPEPEAALPEADRQLLFAWITCGALDD